MRWDDIEILHRIDAHQVQHGGAELWHVSGKDLMEEIAGVIVCDQNLSQGFVQELHNLRGAGLAEFKVDSMPGGQPPAPGSDPYYYLQQVRHFALTTAGQDRARGRVVISLLPDPAEDDGRPISRLVIKEVAGAIEAEYRPDQVAQFLRESGVPVDLPPLTEANAEDVADVLETLDRWGSEGRRVLRSFVARWLNDRLLTGPEVGLRKKLVDQLARQGWYLNDDRLVIGDPAAGSRVTSPILRAARLAALHPLVVAQAERYVGTGHYAEAVFEAMKAVVNRVKDMTGMDVDGVALMNRAFSADRPCLLFDTSGSESGKNVNSGYRFMFVGAVQAIRNPSAHEQFGPKDENEAFEQLNLASLLMRSLDGAVKPTPDP